MSYYHFYIDFEEFLDISCQESEIRDRIKSYLGNNLFSARPQNGARWIVSTFSKANAAKITIAFGIIPQQTSIFSYLFEKLKVFLSRFFSGLFYIAGLTLALFIILIFS